MFCRSINADLYLVNTYSDSQDGFRSVQIEELINAWYWQVLDATYLHGEEYLNLQLDKQLDGEETQ